MTKMCSKINKMVTRMFKISPMIEKIEVIHKSKKQDKESREIVN